MTRAGKEFKVVDAKTGADITHSILTQIIVEEEGRAGATLLPVSFLRQLIAMYGDQMQAMVPHYLEASMEAFRRNQEQARTAMLGMMGGAGNNPFEALARQNMAMLKAAAGLFGQQQGEAATPGQHGAEPNGESSNGSSNEDDVKALKAQLAVLQARLDKLGA